jgi:hypothetical protein
MASKAKSIKSVEIKTEEFKRSMNEWVIFLDSTLRSAKERIYRLEKRIDELESRQQRDIEN